MRGMLLKDFALMKTQWRSVIIIMAVAIFLLLSGENTTFAIIYANVIFMMFGITTLSYDAFENGYAFLFTLPITRKLYVLEKYIFSIICTLAGAIVGSILLVVTTYLRMHYVPGISEISVIFGYVIGASIFLALMLPIEFKFGPEKARIAMITVFMVFMVGLIILKKVLEMEGFAKVIEKIEMLEPMKGMGILGMAAIVLMLVSYLISCKVIEKKEF